MAMELFALDCIELVLHLRNASLNGLHTVLRFRFITHFITLGTRRNPTYSQI